MDHFDFKLLKLQKDQHLGNTGIQTLSCHSFLTLWFKLFIWNRTPVLLNIHLSYLLSPQQLELITPFQLYFNPDLILKHYQVSVTRRTEIFQAFWNQRRMAWHKLFFFLQVWRLVTNFLFFGPVGFNFLFNMIFLYPLSHVYFGKREKVWTLLSFFLTWVSQIPLLSNAGGGVVPRQNLWLCLHVPVWRTSHDCILACNFVNVLL